MKCTVVVLVSMVALLATTVRTAPQRGIDFLPGDEEVQAVVKPIAGDSEVPDQQRQQAPDEADETNDVQQRERQPEVPPSVDPVESEQAEEDPEEEEEPELPEYEDEDEGQYREENRRDVDISTTDALEDATQPTTVATTDATTETANEVTTPAPKEPKPSSDASTTNDSTLDYSSEVPLTTEPIVVAEPGSTEATDESNQLAEDVNSLADNSSNRVRFGLEDNQDQAESHTGSVPLPKPKGARPAQNVPNRSTVLQPVPAVPASDEYDSKSHESDETDDQVHLKVDPNDDQYPTLPPWYSSTRLPAYDQWQTSGSVPQRSSWYQRHYQTNGFDGYHGHGFHRSPWH